MTPDDDPYRVECSEKGHRVVDESGATVLQCSNAPNATQYAVLLNRTYRAGYKSGYRDAKHGTLSE